MSYLWTWDGKFFGHRSGDRLYTHNGLHVGNFHGDEVYSTDGHYLGELRSGRLITKDWSRGKRKAATSRSAGSSCARCCDYVGYAMISGYEDFPDPDSF